MDTNFDQKMASWAREWRNRHMILAKETAIPVWLLCLYREPGQSLDVLESALIATLPPCHRHQARQHKASAAAAELISQLRTFHSPHKYYSITSASRYCRPIAVS